MKKAVVLVSGGLDSATVLALAKRQGFEVYALTVEYGQRHDIERNFAVRVAQNIGVKDHKFVAVGLNEFGGSSLTTQQDIPKDSLDSTGIPSTYVPARNTVMLSLALAYAEVIGSADIFIGANAVDYSGYPDCRPEFIKAFQQLARIATKAGVEGQEFCIHAPLMHWTKPRIIQEGLALGIDYAQTHSCYDPSPDGRPCEHCDSCLIRIRAFAELGMIDPALHRESQS